MKGNGPKSAVVAVLCWAFLPAAAAHAENLAVRNIRARLHAAPRLAGQRSQYLEQQLAYFHARTRDNPFSRQYMWGAAASLTPQSARQLALYYSSLLPKAANCEHSGRFRAGASWVRPSQRLANAAAFVVAISALGGIGLALTAS
jgi:hypothetical protein